MRIKIYLLIIALTTLAFVSCEETKEENKYENWRARNDAFVDSLRQVVADKTDPYLKTLPDIRKGTTIYYKVIEEGDQDADRPFLTSTVKIHYRVMIIDESVFAANPNTKFLTSLYKKLVVADDQTFLGDKPDPSTEGPKEFLVGASGYISGWSATLLQMRPGDRWEVYIPYKSAYYSSAKGDFPAYSTLMYDIEMVDVDYYPKK